MKRSILKKWWFWVLIVVLVPFIVVSAMYTDTGNRPKTTTTQGTSDGETTAPSGFQVGDTAEYQGMALTVTKIEYSTGNDTVKPDAGHVFLHVYLKVENVDADDVTCSPKSFSVMTKDGMARYEFPSDVAIADDVALPIKHLAKGESQEGVVGFIVEEGTTGMQLYYTDNYFQVDAPKLTFTLN